MTEYVVFPCTAHAIHTTPPPTSSNPVLHEDVDVERLIMPPKPQPSIVHDVAPTPLDELINSHEVYNIELAWLAFNWRVLSMALFPKVPLLERLQFLAITNSNLDGFFQKRVGGLMKQQAAGLPNLKARVTQTPSEQLAAISAEVKRMFRWHSWALQQLILPQLQAHGIWLLTPSALSADGVLYLRKFYEEQVDKLLTPIKCIPDHSRPVAVLPLVGSGVFLL
jgi:polyphosphate kinase